MEFYINDFSITARWNGSVAGSEYDSQEEQKIKFTHQHFSAKLVIYRYHGSLSQDRKEAPMKQNIANRSNGFMVSPSFFL